MSYSIKYNIWKIVRDVFQTSKCEWKRINMTYKFIIIHIIYDTGRLFILYVRKCLLNIISRFMMSFISNPILCIDIKGECMKLRHINKNFILEMCAINEWMCIVEVWT
jgi:hypothetical protein